MCIKYPYLVLIDLNVPQHIFTGKQHTHTHRASVDTCHKTIHFNGHNIHYLVCKKKRKEKAREETNREIKVNQRDETAQRERKHVVPTIKVCIL